MGDKIDDVIYEDNREEQGYYPEGKEYYAHEEEGGPIPYEETGFEQEEPKEIHDYTEEVAEEAPVVAEVTKPAEMKGLPSIVVVGADVALILFCLIQFRYPRKSYRIYYFIQTFLLVKCIASLYAADIHKKLGEAHKIILGSLDGAYLFLSFATLFFRTWSIMPVVLAIIAHSFVDLVCTQRPVLRELVPNFEEKTHHALDFVNDKIISIINLVAASCEVVALVTLPFIAHRFLFVPMYIVFVILCYRGSKATRDVFANIDNGINKVLENPSVPPQIKEYYAKFKSIMVRVTV